MLGGGAPAPASAAEVHVEMKDLSGQDSSLDQQAKNMEEFFTDVEQLKQYILLIRSATKEIVSYEEKYREGSTEEQETAVNEQVHGITNRTNSTAQKAKKLLEKIQQETKRLKEENIEAGNLRIRDNLQLTLGRKFVSVTKDYQAAQVLVCEHEGGAGVAAETQVADRTCNATSFSRFRNSASSFWVPPITDKIFHLYCCILVGWLLHSGKV